MTKIWLGLISIVTIFVVIILILVIVTVPISVIMNARVWRSGFREDLCFKDNGALESTGQGVSKRCVLSLLRGHLPLRGHVLSLVSGVLTWRFMVLVNQVYMYTAKPFQSARVWPNWVRSTVAIKYPELPSKPGRIASSCTSARRS